MKNESREIKGREENAGNEGAKTKKNKGMEKEQVGSKCRKKKLKLTSTYVPSEVSRL